VRSKIVVQFCAAASLLLGSEVVVAADGLAQPVAAIKPVTDTYFGTTVTDNYRWMESLDDPAVQQWMRSQASYTRATLDAIPGRADLLKRIHELSNAGLTRTAFTRRGDRYFYEETDPDAQAPKLFYRDGIKGEGHLLLDPAVMGQGSKTHFSLDWYAPSWDGRLVAYGISEGGSEQSVLHILDVATGKPLSEAIDRTQGNQVYWRPDNKSFFYLRYRPLTPDLPPEQAEYDARTFLHTVGAHVSGAGDEVVFGRDVRKTLEVPDGQGTYVVVAPDSSYAIAVANHNMDDNPSTLFIAPLKSISNASTPWQKLANVGDGVTDFQIHGDTLYYLTINGKPRGQLMAMSLAHPDLAHARVVVPESDKVLTGFAIAREGLYVTARDGAVTRIMRVSFDGHDAQQLALPFEGTVHGLVTDPAASGVFFDEEGWTKAAQTLAYDGQTKLVSDTGLTPPSPIDTTGYESKEVFVTSYDGTQIPLSLRYKKGLVLDGSHPTILDGYGSYGIPADPYFQPRDIAWMERGGIVADAHIRGGGDLGEAWHLGGQKLTKLNTIFDFIACGQYLVDQHYTTSKLLAGIGGSAGGITIGGAMTWRPDLFGVILDLVGMSDGLRFETEPNGPPNVSEFGTVKDEAGFHGLYAMSAYWHIHPGVAYPAVLFHTGAHDPRVAPWQMLKMTAKTQAATSSGRPVLLSVDYDAGHGIGSSSAQREGLFADLAAFALWQMGDPAFQPH
jgi:prolyl oligopeptidase